MFYQSYTRALNRKRYTNEREYLEFLLWSHQNALPADRPPRDAYLAKWVADGKFVGRMGSFRSQLLDLIEEYRSWVTWCDEPQNQPLLRQLEQALSVAFPLLEHYADRAQLDRFAEAPYGIDNTLYFDVDEEHRLKMISVVRRGGLVCTIPFDNPAQGVRNFLAQHLQRVLHRVEYHWEQVLDFPKLQERVQTRPQEVFCTGNLNWNMSNQVHTLRRIIRGERLLPSDRSQVLMLCRRVLADLRYYVSPLEVDGKLYYHPHPLFVDFTRLRGSATSMRFQVSNVHDSGYLLDVTLDAATDYEPAWRSAFATFLLRLTKLYKSELEALQFDPRAELLVVLQEVQMGDGLL